MQHSPWLGQPTLGGAERRRKRLAACAIRDHISGMISRAQWRAFIDHPVVEWCIFGTGVLLLLISPLVGAIPGPGGVIVAGVGLAMVLKTSMWARRYYVRFKRKKPRWGRWTDWALRRPSHFRRERLRKQLEAHRAAGPQQPGGAGDN